MVQITSQSELARFTLLFWQKVCHWDRAKSKCVRKENSSMSKDIIIIKLIINIMIYNDLVHKFGVAYTLYRDLIHSWLHGKSVTLFHHYSSDDTYNVALVPFTAIDPIPYPALVPHSRESDYKVFAYISGFNEDQIHYTSFANGIIQLSHQSSGITCMANILPETQFACNNLLYIGFDHNNTRAFMKILNIGGTEKERCKCMLKLSINKSYFKLLHTSVEKIASNVLKKLLVYHASPECSNDVCVGMEKVESLDDSQHKAMIKMAMANHHSSPILVNGPSGTGKSYLICHFIIKVLEKTDESTSTCILVSCHHSASAQSLMMQFKELKPDSSMVLYVSNSLCANFCEFKKHIHKYLQMKQVVIVASSLTASRISSHMPDDFFTHIILEEASQSIEPETVAPLCMANENTNIILVGDPLQVSAKY